MRVHHLFRARVVKRLLAALGNGVRQAGGHFPKKRRVVGQNFLGVDARDFVRQTHARARELIQIEFAGGYVGKHAARAVFVKQKRHDVVGLLLLQHARVNHRAGRDHARDGALHQPLGQRGIGHLLADGNLVAFLNEPRHIHVHRVIRHAAHRRALRQAAVLSRQRQLQLA